MNLRMVIVVYLLSCLSISTAFAEWQFYEQTNVKGRINGTVKKGRVIEMQSGSIYEVTGLTLQLVLELAPEAIVLTDGLQFKISIDGFDELLICKQLVPPRQRVQSTTGNLRSIAPQKSDIPLEELIPMSQQHQMGIQKLTAEEREKLRVYLIGLYMLGVEHGEKGKTTQAPQNTTPSATASAIESQIDGDFEGWKGETIIKLTDGQIWQQTEYYYHYRYAFMPKVLIYNADGGYKMKVEDVDKAVGVTRLK